jgi:hypothetical protein
MTPDVGSDFLVDYSLQIHVKEIHQDLVNRSIHETTYVDSQLVSIEMGEMCSLQRVVQDVLVGDGVLGTFLHVFLVGFLEIGPNQIGEQIELGLGLKGVVDLDLDFQIQVLRNSVSHHGVESFFLAQEVQVLNPRDLQRNRPGRLFQIESVEFGKEHVNVVYD